MDGWYYNKITVVWREKMFLTDILHDILTYEYVTMEC